jgi:hypothetical protein
MRGVNVTLLPPGHTTTTSIADGTFAFPPVPNGSYTVSLGGYCHPFGCYPDTPVTVTGEDVFIDICPLPPEDTPTVTPTPTSIPGPPSLIAPENDTVLPQPIPPRTWGFYWKARTGPCSGGIEITGPEGWFHSADVDYDSHLGIYTYMYASPASVPAGTYEWQTSVLCGFYGNLSEVRRFVVEPLPTATPVPPLSPSD